MTLVSGLKMPLSYYADYCRVFNVNNFESYVGVLLQGI